MAISTRQTYEFGAFRLDPTERILLRGSEPVALTPKVFDTLVLLVENAGRLVTKDDFMRQVWADAFVEEATLAQTISQLRKALGDPEIIETVPKKGYRLLGSVRVIEPGTAARPDASSAENRAALASDGGVPNLKRNARPWLAVSVVFVVLAAAVVLYFLTRSA